MKNVAKVLAEGRSKYTDKLINISASRSFCEELLQLLFPHFNFSDYCLQNFDKIEQELTRLQNALINLLKPIEADLKSDAKSLVEKFFATLPEIYNSLTLDAEAIFQGDPAAKSVDEVIITYPGFFAIAIHRVAHTFYSLDVPLLPRVLSEYSHQKTGIDIHPGAQIGNSFCIDHGTGIVIGETCEIKNNVKIYQGVTLGALSVDKSKAMQKRHPTIEDNVVIYANATILGGETVIGAGSIIGGSVWLTESVGEGATIYHRASIKMG